MADEWESAVRKPAETCTACGVRFETGTEVVAYLEFGDEGLRRMDTCPAYFESLPQRPFSFWRLRRPEALERGPRKLDLAYLTECFKQLVEREEEEARKVLWIVSLLLLRKKILERLGRALEDGREVLTLRLRREDRTFEVRDPDLSDDDVRTLHEDLAHIFDLGGGEEATEGSTLPPRQTGEPPRCLMEPEGV